MKKLIIFLLTISFSYSEQYDLDRCIKEAITKTSLSKQKEFYSKQTELTEKNINSNWLPKISMDGQFTYQSDVFALPFKIPNVTINEIPQEQYKINLNINQMVYDGGLTNSLNQKNEAESQSNLMQVESNLDKIKDRVIKNYLNAITLKKSLEIIAIAQIRLDFEKDRISSMLQNGVATKGMIAKFDLEINKLNQKMINALNDLVKINNSLEELTGLDIDLNSYILPNEPEKINKEINRKELKVMEEKMNILEASKKTSESSILPKVFVFAQGGYGAPNQFNMFETNGDLYYIAGVKLNWELWDWNNSSRNSEILEINKQIIDSEKDNLEDMLRIEQIIANNEIKKYEELIINNLKQLELQQIIVDEKKNQLDNGTTSVNDYLIELNALTEIELNIELNKINLLYSKINLQNIGGNY